MTRVKRGNVARKRHKKILQLSEGFRGASKCLFRVANQHALKALKNSSRDRVQRKISFRSVWITRINAATRNDGLSYSQFVSRQKLSRVILNRKIVSQLAIFDKEAFDQLLSFVHSPL